MPSLGNRTINLHTVDRDETRYVGPTHTVTHTDEYALKRLAVTGKPNPTTPARSQLRADRSFPVPGAIDGLERLATVTITVTAPRGVDQAAVEAWIEDTLVQAAETVGSLGVTGDIHLGS